MKNGSGSALISIVLKKNILNKKGKGSPVQAPFRLWLHNRSAGSSGRLNTEQHSGRIYVRGLSLLWRWAYIIIVNPATLKSAGYGR
jgi:hypothetical protein